MATLTNEQIEQKKQQLKQLTEEFNAIVKELQEAGAWPLSDDELDDVAGGISINHPRLSESFYSDGGVVSKISGKIEEDNKVKKPTKNGILY